MRDSRQLPTYSGTKSYQNLLVEVYGMKSGYQVITKTDSAVQLLPINFIRSGFRYGDSRILGQSTDGRFWTSRAIASYHVSYLIFNSDRLEPQYTDPKGFGSAIRCLVR